MVRWRSALVFLLLLFLAAVVYAIYATIIEPTTPLLQIALAGVIGTVAAVDQIWNRYRPIQKRFSRIQPTSEQTYLEGRFEVFSQEEEMFIPLAGDAIGESPFDAFGTDFPPHKPHKRLLEYTDIVNRLYRE